MNGVVILVGLLLAAAILALFLEKKLVWPSPVRFSPCF